MGDLAPLKPPERNLSIVPEHNENATASGVERIACAPLEIAHGATGVAIARAEALSTKGIPEVTFRLRTVLVPVLGVGVGVQLAVSAGTGVKGVLIDRSGVYVLDDVDLMGCGSIVGQL